MATLFFIQHFVLLINPALQCAPPFTHSEENITVMQSAFQTPPPPVEHHKSSGEIGAYNCIIIATDRYGYMKSESAYNYITNTHYNVCNISILV